MQKTGTEYKVENGFVEQGCSLLLLGARLLFLWPRVTFNLVVTSWQVISKEVLDDLKVSDIYHQSKVDTLLH